MKKTKTILLVLSSMLILLLVFGCTDERKTKLERGVGFIRSLISPSPAQKIAVAHYQANTPEGLIMLYYASLPTDGRYPAAYSDRQNLQPWTILVLPGHKRNSLIIEGYGEDLNKPLIVEEINIKIQD